MKIHFRATCRAKLIEYWDIDAPQGWGSMDDAEKKDWLEDNIDRAEFVAHQVAGEEDRAVLDFQLPSDRPDPPSADFSGRD